MQKFSSNGLEARLLDSLAHPMSGAVGMAYRYELHGTLIETFGKFDIKHNSIHLCSIMNAFYCATHRRKSLPGSADRADLNGAHALLSGQDLNFNYNGVCNSDL